MLELQGKEQALDRPQGGNTGERDERQLEDRMEQPGWAEGSLDQKEGRQMLRYMNPGLSREEIKSAVHAADRNGDGIVETEFYDMMNSMLPTIAEVPKQPPSSPLMGVSARVVSKWRMQLKHPSV